MSEAPYVVKLLRSRVGRISSFITRILCSLQMLTYLPPATPPKISRGGKAFWNIQRGQWIATLSVYILVNGSIVTNCDQYEEQLIYLQASEKSFCESAHNICSKFCIATLGLEGTFLCLITPDHFPKKKKKDIFFLLCNTNKNFHRS